MAVEILPPAARIVDGPVSQWYRDTISCLQATLATVLLHAGEEPLPVLGLAWEFLHIPGDVRPQEFYYRAGSTATWRAASRPTTQSAHGGGAPPTRMSRCVSSRPPWPTAACRSPRSTTTTSRSGRRLGMYTRRICWLCTASTGDAARCTSRM
jgi:hypothetical protein